MMCEVCRFIAFAKPVGNDYSVALVVMIVSLVLLVR